MAQSPVCPEFGIVLPQVGPVSSCLDFGPGIAPNLQGAQDQDRETREQKSTSIDTTTVTEAKSGATLHGFPGADHIRDRVIAGDMRDDRGRFRELVVFGCLR
jgi:hypothetical protein